MSQEQMIKVAFQLNIVFHFSIPEYLLYQTTFKQFKFCHISWQCDSTCCQTCTSLLKTLVMSKEFWLESIVHSCLSTFIWHLHNHCLPRITVLTVFVIITTQSIITQLWDKTKQMMKCYKENQIIRKPSSFSHPVTYKSNGKDTLFVQQDI